MTRHAWAREHLVGYLAGGLTAEERFEIQELLKTDADLSAALGELRGLDDRLRKLFVAAKPPMTLEDRVIRKLRQTAAPAARGSSWRGANWWLIATSFLLVVVAGSVGVWFLDGQGLRMASSAKDERPRVLASGINLFDGSHSMDQSELGSSFNEGGKEPLQRRVLVDSLGEEMAKKTETDKRNLSVNGVVSGLTPAGQLTPDLNVPIKNSTFDFSQPPMGGWSESQPQATIGLGTGSMANGESRGKGKEAPDPATGLQVDNGKIMTERWSGIIPRGGHTFPGGGPVATRKGIPVDEPTAVAGGLPGGGAGEGRDMKAGGGGGSGSTYSSPALPPISQKPNGGKIADMRDSLMRPSDGGPADMLMPGQSELGRSGSNKTREKNLAEFGANGKNGDANKDSPAESIADVLKHAFKPGEVFKDSKKSIDDAVEKRLDLNPRLYRPGAVGNFDDIINKSQDKALAPADMDDKLKDKRLDDDTLSLNQKAAEAQTENKKGDIKKAEPASELPPAKIDGKPDPKPPEPKQADPKPQSQRRIIIRSGDIEFEVDSFDLAVDIIYKLVNRTKGGVVSTTNSDKLANGKMRGTVVVRMPPEELDDFVAAMRRDLFKIGELKGQRIGSQDVTKVYTDMESELRGLRVSEERLIVMMKDTKSTLKDLLAVENQLSKTRTSIEKIEGELRYYSNLAAMSTLTINLNEKEIRIAAGVVESERVQAGVEAEDVDQAFRDAKAAIDELKGRVFRSELKQSAAGQFNAILQFDIAPESAGLMRDRFKQIGTVARLEIDRVQKVEGGGAANRESKVKKGDTQFFVSIYNLANVTPRETVNATIVGADVPASYGKIRTLVAKLKGNLRNTSMQNNDARNVSAVLDFDVRRADEPAVQAALAEAGDFLGRRIERAAESDNVTDTKVRFFVTLKSLGGVTARETNNLGLAVVDVPASYRKLRDAVVKAKGYMRNANLQEVDKSRIIATLDFDVMRTDEPAILAAIAEAGEVLGRRVDRVAESDSVTDARVRFSIQLNSVGSINARESNNLSLAALDVPTSYRKVRDAVAKVKGSMRNANLQETDKSNLTATLEFDVMRADELTLLAAIGDAGEVLSRTLTRRPEGEAVTDAKIGFSIGMVSVASIPARETTTLTIAAVDVPAAFAKLREAAGKAKGQILAANLQETDRENMSATLNFDVLRTDEDAILAALAAVGEQLSRQVDRQASGARVTDAKILFNVSISSANNISPRERYKLGIHVDKVEEKLTVFQALVNEVHGRIVEGPKKTKTANGKLESQTVYMVPLASAAAIAEKFKSAGVVVVQNEKKELKAPEGKLALAEFTVVLFDSEPLVPTEDGFTTQLRSGASVSLRWLSMTASFLLATILFVGPWLLVAWVGYRLTRRMWGSPEIVPATVVATDPPRAEDAK